MITRSFPLLPFLVLAPLALNAGDWSQWRGPTLNGIAAPGQSPPLTWSETENVLWKSALPGQGHSSPALVGDRIFLTTSKISEETQSVLALDRASGSILWETVIAQGQLPEKIHKKNTHASPSPACVDGKVIVSFHSANHIQLAALDDEGNILWNKNAGEYRPQFKFGYGASPLIVGDLVVISSEFPRGGFIAAYRLSDGSQVWTSPRNTWTSYSSPILATFDGQEQILLPGNRGISAFDPATGNVLWSGRGGTKSTCATAVWDNNLVFWSGGFPSKETVAIQVGSGEVAWKQKTKCYEQSLLAHQGYVYGIDDNGVAYCWKGSDGSIQWRERLGGPVSSSPILAGGHIYASNERGQTFVFRPDPSSFDVVATNELGDDLFATPTFCDSRIYLRVGSYQGETRTEHLYCLGSAADPADE